MALGILLTITNVKRRKEFSIDYELGQHIVKFYVTDRFIHATHTVNSDDSETTLYVLAVYLSVGKIKDTRGALWIGIVCDIVAIYMAVLLCK